MFAVGPPGTGKSTAFKVIERLLDGFRRVNQDELGAKRANYLAQVGLFFLMLAFLHHCIQFHYAGFMFWFSLFHVAKILTFEFLFLVTTKTCLSSCVE